MPNFVWTAKDENGQAVVIETVAETPEEAKERLVSEGCTEISLHENEILSEVRKSFNKTKWSATTGYRVSRRNKPPLTVRSSVRRIIIQNRSASICVALVIAYAFYDGDLLLIIWLALAAAFWLGYLYWAKIPAACHRKLLKALDWHRWEEVLRRVRILRFTNRIHFVKVPETGLARYRAKALAGLGKLPEALQEYAPCENQPGCPSWLYKMLMADIYDTARQHDRALELVRAALEEKKRPSAYIGLATRLLRCKKDPDEVRTALAEAEKGILIDDLEKPMVLICHGIVSKLENDLPTARKHFQTALEILERTRFMAFRDGHISKTKARLCCVLAKQGESAEAKKYFLEARKYLVATDETELLAECKQALGEGEI